LLVEVGRAREEGRQSTGQTQLSPAGTHSHLGRNTAQAPRQNTDTGKVMGKREEAGCA